MGACETCWLQLRCALQQPICTTPHHIECFQPRCARRSVATQEQRKPVVWENQVDGTYYAINNSTGDRVPCDVHGRPIAQFHKGISGVASTKKRMSLHLKVLLVLARFGSRVRVLAVQSAKVPHVPAQDMELQKSLQMAEPERPPPFQGGEEVAPSTAVALPASFARPILPHPILPGPILPHPTPTYNASPRPATNSKPGPYPHPESDPQPLSLAP